MQKFVYSGHKFGNIVEYNKKVLLSFQSNVCELVAWITALKGD